MTKAACPVALSRITEDSHGSARAAGTDHTPRTVGRKIRFAELRALPRYLGFEERVRGSHDHFVKEGIVEIIDLQRRGEHVKRYQVRQVRRLILKYNL